MSASRTALHDLALAVSAGRIDEGRTPEITAHQPTGFYVGGGMVTVTFEATRADFTPP